MASEKQQLNKRPPIVVVMGHVDHGKTTLLDYIRKTNVSEREAGGITQAVGAYEIWHTPAQNNADSTQTNAEKSLRKSALSPRESAPPAGRKITFIDTPGHEAFSKMRSRGAEVADIAVLVVAADESVKPQTKEAVETLNQAKTPFIVAITKIDKPGADVEKVKNDLTSNGVLLEDYGGQISYHGVSSKTGEGVNDLLDLILLATDVENLTFDPQAPASGFVLEIVHDRQRGTEASVIVKNGVLKRGEAVSTPTAAGKIKILEDFLGRAADKLEPSAPALIIGFDKAPQVGEEFVTGEYRIQNVEFRRTKRLTVAAKSDKPVLNLILKASDAGSLEALAVVIKALHREEKPLNVIDESVGDITDGDVKDAIATSSVIVGFKNRVNKAASNLAESQKVKIIASEVIYDLVKAVEEFLAGKDTSAGAGELQVLVVFNQERMKEQLVGGKVINGVLRTKNSFDVMRSVEGAWQAVGSGRIISLREKKTDLGQAESGREVGVVAEAGVLIAVGDKLAVKK